MKLILIFICVIFICLVTATTPPRCITTNNVFANSGYAKPTNGEVSWWFLNQLINEDAIYADSSLHATETVLELKGYKTREIQESPLFNTYNQSFETSKYHSITYNDQVDSSGAKVISGVTTLGLTKGNRFIPLAGSAHSKGFFIWNEFGGLHVIHSFPESPTKNTNRFVPNGDKDLSQHAMCTELTIDQLKIIPKYLIYSNSNFQTVDNERLNCWSEKTAKKCFVSLGAIMGTFKDEYQKTHEINKIKNWNFNRKFTVAKKTELDKINTFDKMEIFITNNIFNNPNWMKTIEIGKWVQIAFRIAGNYITSESEISADKSKYNNVHFFKAMDYGTNGEYFLQTSNGRLRANYLSTKVDTTRITDQLKYDIIWKYIRYHTPYSKVTNWISHTMTKGSISVYNYVFTSGDKIDLAFKFQSETKQYGTKGRESLKEISTSEDHSKLFYGSNDDNTFNVFCVGDLNWQGIQALRGGGALCRTDLGYIVDFFNRRVSWLRSRNSNNIPTKYGILNSLFTVRSTTDLDWVRDKLIGGYTLDGSNIMEMVPKSNVKASFKLNENPVNGYKAMLKLKVTKPAVYWELTKKSDVETEPFSLNVYPSIAGKVILCPSDKSNCNFETSIKKLVLQDIKLKVSYVIPDLGSTSFSSDNMEVPIDVKKPTAALDWKSKEELTNLGTSAKIAKKYVDEVLMVKPVPIQSISLIRKDQKDAFIKKFKFPLNFQSTIDQICNGGTGTYFNEECHDLLFLCLYNKETLLNGILKLQLDPAIRLINEELVKANGKNVKTCLEQGSKVNKATVTNPTPADGQGVTTRSKALAKTTKP